MRWVESAACREADPRLFGPEQSQAQDALRMARLSYCLTCPVRLQCLTHAQKAGEFGIWGGMYFPEKTRPRQDVYT